MTYFLYAQTCARFQITQFRKPNVVVEQICESRAHVVRNGVQLISVFIRFFFVEFIFCPRNHIFIQMPAVLLKKIMRLEKRQSIPFDARTYHFYNCATQTQGTHSTASSNFNFKTHSKFENWVCAWSDKWIIRLERWIMRELEQIMRRIVVVALCMCVRDCRRSCDVVKIKTSSLLFSLAFKLASGLN